MQMSVDPDPSKKLTQVFSELADYHEREANRLDDIGEDYEAALHRGAYHANAVAQNIAHERGL